jgi:hypothetical protein
MLAHGHYGDTHMDHTGTEKEPFLGCRPWGLRSIQARQSLILERRNQLNSNAEVTLVETHLAVSGLSCGIHNEDLGRVAGFAPRGRSRSRLLRDGNVPRKARHLGSFQRIVMMIGQSMNGLGTQMDPAVCRSARKFPQRANASRALDESRPNHYKLPKRS